LQLVSFLFKRLALDQGNHLSRLVVRIAIAGVAVGIVVILAATAIVNGFQQSIPAKFTGFWGHIQVSRLEISQSFEQQPFAMRSDMLDSIQALPEVDWVAPYATKAGIIRTEESFEGVILKGIDASYDQSFLASCLLAGRLPDFATAENSNEILLPESVLKRLKLKLGDKIQFYFIQDPPRLRLFTIVGVYKLGIEGEFSKPFVISDLRHIQRLNNWEPDECGSLEVHLLQRAPLQNTAYEISDLVDLNLEAYTIEELYPNLFSWLNLFDLNKQVLMVIMLLVAGINMISALLILILERTQTIGLFKAFGMLNRDIRRLFLLTGTYIAGIGMLIGNGLALLFYWLQTRFQLIKLDENNYYVSAVPLEISAAELLILNIATLTVCVLLLVLPSLAIARIKPVEAIRFD
jgi:lipoprotein-releasing system permease protein